MRARYYYIKEDAKLGPITPDEIRELAKSGILVPSTELIDRKTGKRFKAAKIRGLFKEPQVKPIVAPPVLPPRTNSPAIVPPQQLPPEKLPPRESPPQQRPPLAKVDLPQVGMADVRPKKKTAKRVLWGVLGFFVTGALVIATIALSNLYYEGYYRPKQWEARVESSQAVADAAVELRWVLHEILPRIDSDEHPDFFNPKLYDDDDSRNKLAEAIANYELAREQFGDEEYLVEVSWPSKSSMNEKLALETIPKMARIANEALNGDSISIDIRLDGETAPVFVNIGPHKNVLLLPTQDLQLDVPLEGKSSSTLVITGPLDEMRLEIPRWHHHVTMHIRPEYVDLSELSGDSRAIVQRRNVTPTRFDYEYSWFHHQPYETTDKYAVDADGEKRWWERPTDESLPGVADRILILGKSGEKRELTVRKQEFTGRFADRITRQIIPSDETFKVRHEYLDACRKRGRAGTRTIEVAQPSSRAEELWWRFDATWILDDGSISGQSESWKPNDDNAIRKWSNSRIQSDARTVFCFARMTTQVWGYGIDEADQFCFSNDPQVGYRGYVEIDIGAPTRFEQHYKFSDELKKHDDKSEKAKRDAEQKQKRKEKEALAEQRKKDAEAAEAARLRALQPKYSVGDVVGYTYSNGNFLGTWRWKGRVMSVDASNKVYRIKIISSEFEDYEAGQTYDFLESEIGGRR